MSSYALVNETTNTGGPANNITTTIPAPTQGNFLIISSHTQKTTPAAVINSITLTGASFNSVINLTYTIGAQVNNLSIWRGQINSAAPGTSLVVHYNNVAASIQVDIEEWSGINIPTPVDGSGSTVSWTTTSSSETTAAYSTTVANDLVVAVIDAGGVAITSNPTGYTGNTSVGSRLQLWYNAVSGSGAQSATFGLSSSPGGAIVFIGFQPAIDNIPNRLDAPDLYQYQALTDYPRYLSPMLTLVQTQAGPPPYSGTPLRPNAAPELYQYQALTDYPRYLSPVLMPIPLAADPPPAPPNTQDSYIPVTGTMDGVNRIFVLANTPADILQLYRNGVSQSAGGTKDYTILANVVTFNMGSIPQPGDILIAVALKSAAFTTISGAINGVNTVFTLAVSPGFLALYRNGILQSSQAGGDYTLSGNTITFNAGAVPQTGDNLLAKVQ